jgi:hypothetical protein
VQARVDLIARLEADGLLAPNAAATARERYAASGGLPLSAAPPPRASPSVAERAAQLLTLANFFKLCAIVVLLLAFELLLELLADLLKNVPVEVPQGGFLAAGLVGAAVPQKIWRSQASYVAILASIAVLLDVLWSIRSHDGVSNAFDSAEKAGWPAWAGLCAGFFIFFAGLATVHHIQVCHGTDSSAPARGPASRFTFLSLYQSNSTAFVVSVPLHRELKDGYSGLWRRAHAGPRTHGGLRVHRRPQH